MFLLFSVKKKCVTENNRQKFVEKNVCRRFFCLVTNFLLGFLALIFTQSSLAETVQIQAFNYPPYISQDPIEKKGYGLGVDITNQVFKRLGLNTHFKFYPMQRSIYLMENHLSQISLGTISQFKNGDPAKSDIIAVEIFPISFVFYYLQGSISLPSYNSLTELKHYSVGNVRGSATTKALKNLGFEKIVWSTSIASNLEMCLMRRFDLCVAEEYTADNFFSERNVKGLKIIKLDPPILQTSMTLNFSEEKKELAEKFREELKKLKSEGGFFELVSLYFGNTGLALAKARQ